MTDHYALLAPIYERIGMANFAQSVTPRIFQFAQSRLDWSGRRALDLGCGTGASARWLANHGVSVVAIDSSPDMLLQARGSIDTRGLSLTWRQGDIRVIDTDLLTFDIVLAIDVINELGKLSEIEAVFAQAYRALEEDKLFVFDMMSLEALIMKSGRGGIFYEDNDINIVLEQNFDYERLALVKRMLIFSHTESWWRREEIVLTSRGYSVQTVAALLKRVGFSVAALVNPAFEVFDPATSHTERVIFFARKQSGA